MHRDASDTIFRPRASRTKASESPPRCVRRGTGRGPQGASNDGSTLPTSVAANRAGHEYE